MIKTFEEFINENYNEIPAVVINDVYGDTLFNEVSESMLSNIYNSINEGKLVLDTNMIEEGLFDSIENLFRKGAKKMKKNIWTNDAKMLDTSAGIEFFNNLNRESSNKAEYADEIETLAKQLQLFDKESKVYEIELKAAYLYEQATKKSLDNFDIKNIPIQKRD